MKFIEYDLALEIQTALIEAGFSDPTELQQLVIPHALDGRDIAAAGPTGSGKTLAYLLPALQHILDQRDDTGESSDLSVIVLAPTRELVNQVVRVLQPFVEMFEVKVAALTGGVPYGSQYQALVANPPEIVVATPGRLVDLIDREWVDLTAISMLVIDEADRMLDMGFIDLMLGIQKHLPPRQTLMLSATLESERLTHAARELLKEPEFIEAAPPRKLAAGINQTAYRVDNDEHKQAVLRRLVTTLPLKQTLLFVSSRRQVEHWVDVIRAWPEIDRNDFRCEGIHGEIPQGVRTDRINKFRRGRTRLLVSTDVAARGIDLSTISHVININLPQKADTYVHRAGRTARAEGSQGDVILLVDGQDWPMLGRIERYLQEPIPRATLEGLAPKRSEAELQKAKKAKAKTKKNVKKSSAPKKSSSTKKRSK